MTFNYARSLYRVLAPGLLLAGVSSSVAAQQSDTVTARRIAAVTAIALTEYRTGVVDGKVVAAGEVEEARLFVADAHTRAGDLSPAVRRAVLPWLDSLAAGVAAHRPADQLAGLGTSLRAALVAAVGNLDPLPQTPPSLAMGRAVYVASCATCHGPL